MADNKTKNRREELYAEAVVNTGLQGAIEELSEGYDIISSDCLDNPEILANNLKNAVRIEIKQKHDVYGNRLYGESDGCYHVSSDGSVYEGASLKFGSVKTGEGEKSIEKILFFFRKRALKSVEADLHLFDKAAEGFYTQKSAKNAKKPISQKVFNFYRFLVIVNLFAVLAFFATIVWAFVQFLLNGSGSILGSAPGGVASLWLLIGVSFILTVVSGILYSKRIEAFRPTDRGMNNTDFTMHGVIMIVIEVFTVIFAAIFVANNIFGFTVGKLFFPAALACFIYPLVIFAFLKVSWDDFHVGYIMRRIKAYTEEEYEQWLRVENRLLEYAVMPDCTLVKDAVIICIPSDEAEIHVSKW